MSHSAWHTYGATGCTRARDRRTLIGWADVAQVVLGGRGRRGLAAVEGADGMAGCVVVEGERSPTNARRLWFDQSEDRLRGDERIGGGTAITQHIAGGLGGEWISGGGSVGLGLHGLHAGAVAGGCLGAGEDVSRRLRGTAGIELCAGGDLAAGHGLGCRLRVVGRTGSDDERGGDDESGGPQQTACARWTAHACQP